jgi:hypothetical protein
LIDAEATLVPPTPAVTPGRISFDGVSGRTITQQISYSVTDPGSVSWTLTVQAPGAFTDGGSSDSPSAWRLDDPGNGQPLSASRVTVARAAASASGVFRVQATLPARAPAGRYAPTGGLLVKTGKQDSADMAHKTIVSLVDDISGGPADER